MNPTSLQKAAKVRGLGAILITGLVLCCIFNAGSLRAESPANAQTQTVLFLGEKDLLVIEFQLTVDGKPFSKAWEAGLSEIVQELDRDKNGSLSRKETDGPAEKKESEKPGSSPAAQAFLKTANLWDADAEPKDGELTAAEIAAFLARQGRGAFQAESSKATAAILSPQPVRANNAGSRLWDWLDDDDDGEITAKELRSTNVTLKKYDLDSDESISLNELEGSENPFFFAQPSNQTMESPFFAAGFGQSETKVVRKLIEKLGTLKEIAKETKQESGEEASEDANKRTKPHGVKLDVLGIPKDLEAEFDRDGDGMLDLLELRAYLRSPVPMVTVTVPLSKSGKAEPALSGKVREPKSEIVVKTSSSGAVSVLVGEIQIEIDTAGLRPEILLESLEERFKQSDGDGNGYLEQNEARRDPFFQGQFKNYDADGNEKLYPEEWRQPALAQIRFAGRQTRMVVQDAGQDVFSVLDGDRSLKITPREWLDAADRLSVWDKNGNGNLEQNEVPHVYRISFGPGLPDLPGLISPQSGNQQTPTVQQLVKGPKWFQALDKNNDGDVSQNEFLGQPEVFEQIDLDQDKLIDPREAAKFKE